MRTNNLLRTGKRRLCLVALIATICASAQTYVALDTDHFSQGMITYLKKSTVTNKHIKTVDGVECINVDGPTTLNFTADVDDTKGLRLFKNVTSINATGCARYCKHFDARGLSKLATITFTTQNGAAVTATANDAIKINTILVDSTAITQLALPRCINLRHVSCSNCPNLQTVYLYECDLMGLDLSSSTQLTNVIVYGNPNLSVIRLPESAPKLSQLHVCHTNLQELIIPADMGNGLAGDRKITLNVDNTKVKKIVMPVYDLDRGLKKPYIQSFIYGTGSLLSFNVSQMDCSTGTWTTSPSNTTAVGHVDSFTIFDEDENLTNDRNMKTSATGFTAGAGTFDGRVFTFAEGKTSVSYTINSYTQRNIKTASTKCTVTRTLDAPEIYLEFAQNNPTLDKLYQKYMGDEIVESFDEDGKPRYKRIKLEYRGNNRYELTSLPCLMGNFHFVLVDADGTESVIGANDADLTELLPEWLDNSGNGNGHAYLRLPGNSQARAYSEANFNLHLTQAAAKMNSHQRKNQQYSQSAPHEFSTHYNEPAGLVGRIENPSLTLTYIKGDPANSMSVGAPGGTTAVDDIIVDNLPGFGNEDSANAPVMYYDMQGRRIDNPANGLYIRRQGTRAEKVLIR